jgi:hypothetical protein
MERGEFKVPQYIYEGGQTMGKDKGVPSVNSGLQASQLDNRHPAFQKGKPSQKIYH